MRYFRASSGREPFWEWLDAFKDQNTRARILARLDRLEEGNFGICRRLERGLVELKLDFGPGHRIYIGEDGARIVILLTGGGKKNQQRDIRTATEYWIAYLTGRTKHEK